MPAEAMTTPDVQPAFPKARQRQALDETFRAWVSESPLHRSPQGALLNRNFEQRVPLASLAPAGAHVVLMLVFMCVDGLLD